MKLDSTGFKTIVGFLIALTTLVGTAFTVDNRYAKDQQVKKVEKWKRKESEKDTMVHVVRNREI